MTDGPSVSEESLQTPQSRNAALREIVSHFPKNPTIEPEETDEYVARIMSRGNSEHRVTLVSRAKSLIATAPVTDDFKTFVLDQLEAISRFGLTGSGGQDYMLYFLDSDVPGSGGIFDPARAVHLERVGIRHDSDATIAGEERMGKIMGVEKAKESFAPRMERIELWKKNFEAHYNQPPTLIA